MPDIGIVGAGIAGLHLGLLLRQHDVPVTLYTDRPPAQLAGARLLNTVTHHGPTLARERALGVDFWSAQEYGYSCHHYAFGGPQPLNFRGNFTHRSSAIDHRLYLPKLAEAFEERGGRLEIKALQAHDIEPVADRHDLLAVAAGRGAFADLFARVPQLSPYDGPQRVLSAGLYDGIAEPEPKGLTSSLSPRHGELLEIPMYSRDGFTTALGFENIPGGDLEVLARQSYADDRRAYERQVRAGCRRRAHRPRPDRWAGSQLRVVLGPGDRRGDPAGLRFRRTVLPPRGAPARGGRARRGPVDEPHARAAGARAAAAGCHG